jgi:protein O-mannosyl-transferase
MSFSDLIRAEDNRSGSAAGMAVLRAAGGLILAAVYVLYAPVLGFQFVYDDVFQIVNNSHLDSWRFLPAYFTEHVWSHVPSAAANFYRPLFLLWLRMNNLIFGHEAAGWHFTTLLLHLVVICLVYVVARSLTGNRAGALIAALLFGVHPVHVESVAWVSGVTEPLSAVFFLGSLLCYLHRESAGSQEKIWLAASLLLFSAGLLTKETVAALPLLILAYELTAGHAREGARPRSRRIFVDLLPYWVLLAAYLAVRTFVLHGLASDATPVPLIWSVLSWPWLLCFYLRLLVWPVGLSPLYDPFHVSGLAQPGLLVPLLVLIVAAAVLAWLIRKPGRRLVAFLTAWFLLTLAPAMVIFCLAPPDEAFHDRYLYLPSVAFALAAGALFTRVWKRAAAAGRAASLAAAMVVAFALAMATHRQLAYWTSNYILFQRAAAVAPHNATANLNFAAELIKTRDYQRALQLSEKSAQLNPDSARAWASAAAASSSLGDYSRAKRYYARAVFLDPGRGDLLYHLGVTRMKLGEYRDAVDALRKAATISPQLQGVHYSLGLAEAHLGEWSTAAQQFRTELTFNPDADGARSALAEAKSHCGNVSCD